MDLLGYTLSPEWRILLSLAPGVAVLLYFLSGYVAFRIRFRHGAAPRYPEIEDRQASELLPRRFRSSLLWTIGPVEHCLVRLRIRPNVLSMVGLLLAAASGLALAHGRFALGGWLYLFSGIFDIFDGRVARATGRVSLTGRILDSVGDRYSEFFFLAGLAWFYADRWVILVVLVALFGSMMVSYVRARAEAMGMIGSVGRFQRPERVFYLGVPTALAPIPAAIWETGTPPMHWLAVAALVFVAVGANGTALGRLIHLLRQTSSTSGAHERNSTDRARSRLPAAVGRGPTPGQLTRSLQATGPS